jgi:hypothetical protein
MDENLAITTNNFISNPVISPFKIEMQNLIECIKASKKLHYDNKQKLIRFREKADRNIVIFKDILLDSTNENYENICKLIKQKITEKSENLNNFLKEVEKIENNIFFNFENEKYACDLEKILDESKKNKENFFENLNYFLAAETYGRRITPYLNNKITKEEQINLVKVILNKQNINLEVIPKEKRRNTFDNNRINKRNFSILENNTIKKTTNNTNLNSKNTNNNNYSNNNTKVNGNYDNNNKVEINKNLKKQPNSMKGNYNNRFLRNSFNIVNNNNGNGYFNNYNNNLGYTPYYSKINSSIDYNNNIPNHYANELNTSNGNFNSLMNNANYLNNTSLKGYNQDKFFYGDSLNDPNIISLNYYDNNSFIESKKPNNTNNNIMNMNMNMNSINQPINKFDLFAINNSKYEEKKINENNDNNIRRSSSKKLDPKNENLFDIKKVLNNLSSNDTNRNSINLEGRLSNSVKGSFSYLRPYLEHNNNINNEDNNLISRGSILSKFSNINIPSDKAINRASFMSYGGDENFFNEIQKNFYMQRKSSLNYLKSNLNLMNLKSSFIIDNININNKEVEKNGVGYSTTDIISVYFHMNYLKQFKFPQEFDNENNFLEGVMRKEVKHNLEKFKEKDVLLRNRARTMILNITNNAKKRSNLYLN